MRNPKGSALLLVAALLTSATVTGQIDTDAPGPVTNLRFSGVQLDNLTTYWDAPGDPDVASYTVYYDDKPFSNIANAANSVSGIAPTGYNISELSQGTRYFVTVAAVDATGNQGPAIMPPLAVRTLTPKILFEIDELIAQEDEVQIFYKVSLNAAPKFSSFVWYNVSFVEKRPGEFDLPKVDLEVINFTKANYHKPHWINLTFEDDDVIGGDREYLLNHTVMTTSASRDDRFDASPTFQLPFTIVENELIPGIKVDVDEIQLTEGGGSAIINLELESPPEDDVFVQLTGFDEDRLEVVGPSILRYGALSWNTSQSLHIRATDNEIVDGSETYKAALSVVTSQSSREYASRNVMTPITISITDDEVDEDMDGILDSEDKDTTNRFDKDWRPSKFRHQISVDGENMRFTWTGEHLDKRIEAYQIWEMPGQISIANISHVEGKRNYEYTMPTPEGVHGYRLHAVLFANTFDFDSEVVIGLGTLVNAEPILEEECFQGAPDGDLDGVCSAFEQLAGMDPGSQDTDADGRTDDDEVLKHGTDPTDPNSYHTILPRWMTNIWFVMGSFFMLWVAAVTFVSIAEPYIRRPR